MSETPVGDWQRLGTALRDARISKGMTQQTLADRAGVSRAWLARFETGHRRAEMENVFRLLAALDLSLNLRPTTRTSGEAAALAALRARRDGN